jgi:NAD(P)-dependent dehydrogenase (short-subunit alcohol dehydrogenase family)
MLKHQTHPKTRIRTRHGTIHETTIKQQPFSSEQYYIIQQIALLLVSDHRRLTAGGIMLLTGKTALVTGGGRGIGRSIALSLAKRGAAVALMARTANDIEQVAGEITALGGRALPLAGDVANLVDVVRVVEQTKRELGSIDILINNAAILGPLDATDQVDPTTWVQAQQVNLIGAFYCQRSVMPDMLASGWGRIVNISSGAATGTGMSRASAYSVSKAALDMLSKATGAEVSGRGIAITSVYPGIVDTAMQAEIRSAPEDHADPALVQRFRENYARGLLADPDHVGELIAAVVLGDFNGQIVDVRTDRETLLRLL